MDQFANAAAAIQASVDQNNAWSAQQAQKQMDFQREMSNTAHQREIADLKAAGLNPVLSAKLGGASTPSGAMATGDTSGTSALVDLLQTAMETANTASIAAARSAGSGSGSGGRSGSRSGLSSDGNPFGIFSLDPEEQYESGSALAEALHTDRPRNAIDHLKNAFSWILRLGVDNYEKNHDGDSSNDVIPPRGTSAYNAYLKATNQTDSGSSTGAKQILAPVVASAKGLVKDLDKIFYPRKPSYSVTYNGDGKSKGSSVWHAGGGSSKRVHQTR